MSEEIDDLIRCARMSDWDPELYNRFREYRAEPVAMMLQRLQLAPRERVVDLGCGTGEHTAELARRTPAGYVLGIDSSPAMIERALKLHAAMEPDLQQRLEFRLADFRDFAAHREYTVVFSNAALQWASDHRSILTAVYRALHRNGRLAAQIPANENEPAQATMRQMAQESPWNTFLNEVRTPSDENVLSPREYTALLSDVGFAEVDCFYHVFRHPMQNPAAVVEFCRSTSLRRFLNRLPAAQQPKFTAELTRRLEAAYGTRGQLTFSFRRLFLWGRRPPDSQEPSN
jgi:trans-aconitate 2-methyltransferase